ncbi:MAG: M15 family metallopeptidase, partial [Thermoanaerobaculia bacterium]
MGNHFTDVIQKDQRYLSTKSVTDRTLLEPKTREAVEAIIADAKTMGVSLMSWETFRSQPRQEQLFTEGRTKLKKVGVHHYGLACDIVREVNGKPSWDGDFSIIGLLAKKHGLIWGGDWKTFPDAYHVQRVRVADQPKLFA